MNHPVPEQIDVVLHIGTGKTGTTTVQADGAGRAEFTDLVISGDGGQRTFVFSAQDYGSVTSAAIDVQPAPTGP